MATRRWAKLKLVSVIFLAAIVIILMIQNTEPSNAHVFFWHLTLPRIVLLLITLGVGFTIGVVIGASITGRKKR